MGQVLLIRVHLIGNLELLVAPFRTLQDTSKAFLHRISVHRSIYRTKYQIWYNLTDYAPLHSLTEADEKSLNPDC